MKNRTAALILVILFLAFSAFVSITGRYKTVLLVDFPTKIKIDLNDDNYICVDNIESFSMNPTDEFVEKYLKSLNLSRTDIISLGFLAQDFAQKTLLNKKVSISYLPKHTIDCKYADIKLNGISYSLLLANSGFGIKDGKIQNEDKFKQNLEQAKKLNLVVLNHHSGKYHTLDCPYGNAAHDYVVIPKNQLPSNVKPCKFCHNINKAVFKHKVVNNDNLVNIANIIKPALTLTDGSIKFYLTDFTKTLKPNNRCETSVCKEIVNLINLSKESIDIAIYGYDDNPSITYALQSAHNRGVKIRFVYDENFDKDKTYYKANQIIASIAQVSKSDRTNSKTQSNMLMHNKFMIFDRQKVLTGSLNISNTGLSGFDVNDVIIINSKEIALLYIEEFEQMLSGKFHGAKSLLNSNRKFLLGNSEIEVYFSPKDKSCARIIQLIDSAKNYIYLPVFLITHKGISEALISAKARGVDVRLIIDANSTSTRNSKHAYLRQNKILLKTENYSGKLHLKTIIIDDEYLITGSMNFSNSGENKNDENLLIIKNSKIAKAHKDFFLYLWTKIPNKYLKYNAKSESPESIGSCSDGVDNNFNGKIDNDDELCRQ